MNLKTVAVQGHVVTVIHGALNAPVESRYDIQLRQRSREAALLKLAQRKRLKPYKHNVTGEWRIGGMTLTAWGRRYGTKR